MTIDQHGSAPDLDRVPREADDPQYRVFHARGSDGVREKEFDKISTLDGSTWLAYQ